MVAGEERGAGEPSAERAGAPPTGPDVQPYLAAHAARLEAAGMVRSEAVGRAFRRVPRHLFVEGYFQGLPEAPEWVAVDPAAPAPAELEKVYSGAVLPTRHRGGVATSSASDTGVVAQMLELAVLGPGMRVLEIGAGTGYNAALLAELVGDPALVTTVDIQPDVAAHAERALAQAGYAGVRVRCRDGFEGAPEAAPFDRIIATVGCPDVSPRWETQLAPGGSMLLPLRHGGADPLVRVWREGEGAGEVGAQGANRLRGAFVGFAAFVSMSGALADPASSGPPGPTGPSPGPGAAPTEEVPLWPGLRPEQGAPPWRVQRDLSGFWFYLGSRDPRTRWLRRFVSYGLLDPETGHAVGLEPQEGCIRLWGARRLLEDLESHYAAWRRLGAPGLSDIRLAFVPPDAAPAAPDPGGGRRWTMDGRYYRRVLWVGDG